MKILIFGQFSNNRGDEAAGRAMAYGILEKFPDSRIFTYYCDQNIKPVVPDNENFTNIFKKRKNAGKFILWLILQFVLDKIKFKYPLFREARDLIVLIKNMDIVSLSPGGPYIGDLYDFRNELIRLVVLFIAHKYKKKTMIYGPSMGPFINKIRNAYRKRFIRTIDVIIVRDKQSYKYVQDLTAGGKNIFSSTDCVFSRQVKYLDAVDQILSEMGFSKQDKLVGITPIDLRWHKIWGKDKSITTDLNRIIAQASDILVKDFGYKLLLIPQIFGPKNDMKCIEDVFKKMQFKNQCRILNPKYDTDIQQMIFSKLFFVIGCRHHSVVLANLMRTPAISIAYEFKIISYMQEMGLGDYVIPLEELTRNILISRCQQLIECRENYKSHLDRQVPKLEKIADLYIAKLKWLYEKNCN